MRILIQRDTGDSVAVLTDDECSVDDCGADGHFSTYLTVARLDNDGDDIRREGDELLGLIAEYLARGMDK